MTRESLRPDSLEKALLDKLRRVGADRLGVLQFEHDGEPWEVTANTISTIRTVHITAESVRREGLFRSMVVVQVNSNGYSGGPGGLDHVLQALVGGVRMERVTGEPATTSFHVLPVVETPAIFRAADHGVADADL